MLKKAAIEKAAKIEAEKQRQAEGAERAANEADAPESPEDFGSHLACHFDFLHLAGH